MKSRDLTESEKRLLRLLVAKAGLGVEPDWAESLQVKELEDGGMGSLLLGPGLGSDEERGFGRAAAEVQFQDDDGVGVIATLNLDKDGRLFELDIWKVDFSPLVRIPDAIALCRTLDNLI